LKSIEEREQTLTSNEYKRRLKEAKGITGNPYSNNGNSSRNTKKQMQQSEHRNFSFSDINNTTVIGGSDTYEMKQ